MSRHASPRTRRAAIASSVIAGALAAVLLIGGALAMAIITDDLFLTLWIIAAAGVVAIAGPIAWSAVARWRRR